MASTTTSRFTACEIVAVPFIGRVPTPLQISAKSGLPRASSAQTLVKHIELHYQWQFDFVSRLSDKQGPFSGNSLHRAVRVPIPSTWITSSTIIPTSKAARRLELTFAQFSTSSSAVKTARLPTLLHKFGLKRQTPRLPTTTQIAAKFDARLKTFLEQLRKGCSPYTGKSLYSPRTYLMYTIAEEDDDIEDEEKEVAPESDVCAGFVGSEYTVSELSFDKGDSDCTEDASSCFDEEGGFFSDDDLKSKAQLAFESQLGQVEKTCNDIREIDGRMKEWVQKMEQIETTVAGLQANLDRFRKDMLIRLFLSGELTQDEILFAF